MTSFYPPSLQPGADWNYNSGQESNASPGHLWHHKTLVALSNWRYFHRTGKTIQVFIFHIISMHTHLLLSYITWVSLCSWKNLELLYFRAFQLLMHSLPALPLFFFTLFLPHLFYFVVFFLIYLISFSIFTLQATQVARPRGILPVIPMASPGVPTSICPCFHSLPLFFNACTISWPLNLHSYVNSNSTKYIKM